MSQLDGLRLSSLFDIKEAGTDVWSAPNPMVERSTVFGGQVTAQAVIAASRTVDPTIGMHSLHAYFLRSGTPGEPMFLAVERTRDGRSFSTRRVVARQNDTVIFSALLSFHRREETPTLLRPMPQVPGPRECPELTSIQAAESAVELLGVPAISADSPLGELRAWVRARDTLPDDSVAHTAAIAYMSDFRTGSAVIVGLGETGGRKSFAMMATLDHALWVHDAFRADEWLLMSVETLGLAHGRGLVLGSFHTYGGLHVASFTQELVIRPKPQSGGH
jgi:acyl-CoA thioesterase-2